MRTRQITGANMASRGIITPAKITATYPKSSANPIQIGGVTKSMSAEAMAATSKVKPKKSIRAPDILPRHESIPQRTDLAALIQTLHDGRHVGVPRTQDPMATAAAPRGNHVVDDVEVQARRRVEARRQ